MNQVDPPIIFFASDDEWERWLAVHYADPTGILIKFAKKSSGIASLDYDEALDVALCYGWIDGQSKSLDDQYYLQKFTPRRQKSMWSKRNVAKIAELTRADRMQSSGIAAVEAAKHDGRWEQAYDAPSTMQVPLDFQAGLDARPTAKAFFDTLNKTNRYAFLWRIQTAKKPETRTTRIKQFLELLTNHQTLH